MTRTSLPPGFRFHPTDVELVKFYLQRQVMGKPFRFNVIREIDIYKFAPEDLRDKSYLKSKDLEWYFFCPRERKYSNGARMNRTTEFGFWKTTGKDRSILYNEQTVGMIKTLIFHIGRAPKGARTDWVMHEYRLEDKDLADAGVVQDAYVLCKIFQKSGPGPKNGAQYGAPFNEEEWSDDEVVAGVESFPLAVMSAPAPVLQNNQDGSAVTSTFIPGTICIGSSSESTPSKTVQSTDNVPRPVQDEDVSMLENSLNPDDDLLSMLDCFNDDVYLVPNENHGNENLDNVNRDGFIQSGSLEVNNIYNDLTELGKLPEFSEDGIFSNGSNTDLPADQMLACEDGLYLELNDLQLPIGGPSDTYGSQDTPIDPVLSHYNMYNSSEQPYYPSKFDVVQHAPAISESSVLPEGSNGFENHLDVYQEDNGAREDANLGYQKVEATLNNAEVVWNQPELDSRYVSQVQTRGEQQRRHYSRLQQLLESIPAHPASASELRTSISDSKKSIGSIISPCSGSSIPVKAEAAFRFGKCTKDTLSYKLGDFSYLCDHGVGQPRKLLRKNATFDSGVAFVIFLLLVSLIWISMVAIAVRVGRYAWNLGQS